MGTVVIDDRVLEAVKRMASARGVTTSEQAEDLISAGLNQRPEGASLRSWAESIAAMTPPAAAQTDSTLLVKAERER